MPIGLDPNQTFKIVLESDRDKNPQPCFVYRYLTASQWRKLAEIEQKASGTAVQMFDCTVEAARLGLIGWENMAGPDGDIPFDADRLPDMLTIGELQELFQKVLSQGSDSGDKKKLE